MYLGFLGGNLLGGNLLGGNRPGGDREASIPAMEPVMEEEDVVCSEGSGDLSSIDTEDEIDLFHGHNTLTYLENGTTEWSDHKNIDADVAANLLNAFPDFRVYNGSLVELMYYPEAPNLKVYLLRNRVMLCVNTLLWRHHNIKAKGPAVVFHLEKRPNPIVPISRPPILRPRAVRIPAKNVVQAADAMSPAIPFTFREILF